MRNKIDMAEPSLLKLDQTLKITEKKNAIDKGPSKRDTITEQ